MSTRFNQEILNDFPFNYKEGQLESLLHDGTKKKDELLQDYLTQQKLDVAQFSRQKRLFVIKNKKEEQHKKKKSMSNGLPKHAQEFKSKVQVQEFFQTQKPILKFPNDIVLNTFDTTKRFLKELRSSQNETQQKNQELRQNNFHHYKGDPFNYIKVDTDYFGEFQIYGTDHQNTTLNARQTGIQTPSTYFAPVNVYPKLFSVPTVDRVEIKIPLAGVHEVKYWSEQVKPGLMKNSMLNQKQKVNPFKPIETHANYFQSDYLKGTYKSTMLEPLLSKTTQNKKNGESFLNRGVSPLNRGNSPNRSLTPRATPGREHSPS